MTYQSTVQTRCALDKSLEYAKQCLANDDSAFWRNEIVEIEAAIVEAEKFQLEVYATHTTTADPKALTIALQGLLADMARLSSHAHVSAPKDNEPYLESAIAACGVIARHLTAYREGRRQHGFRFPQVVKHD